MAVVYKRADPSVMMYGKSATFTAAGATNDFVQGDTIDIMASLSRGSIEIEISCAADATVTLLLNAYNREYPIYSHALPFDLPAPDLQTEGTWVNTDAPEVVVGNSETIVLTDPISNLYVSALTKGAGAGVVIKVK